MINDSSRQHIVLSALSLSESDHCLGTTAAGWLFHSKAWRPEFYRGPLLW